ncbi:MAG: hypothetical protein V4608_16755 [Bacteroidota bacterium]
MRIFKICSFVLLTTFAQTSFAQREENHNKPDTLQRKKPLNILRPTSFKNPDIFTANFLKSLPSIKTPTLDRDSIEKYVVSMQPHPYTPKSTDTGRIEYQASPDNFFYEGPRIEKLIDLKKNAQYHNANINNGQLWILKISTTSTGLRFIYSSFFLPEGSTLHLYTITSMYEQEYYGPFTSANNRKDPSRKYVFTSPMIHDKVVYLEYFELNDAPTKGSIVISSVVQAY